MPREINLLPPSRRRQLRREAFIISFTYFLNSVLLGTAALAVAGVVALAGLWVIGTRAADTAADELVARVAVYQAKQAEIQKQNLFVQQIHALSSKRVIWSDFTKAFLKTVPPGATISVLSGKATLNDAEIQNVELSFSGVAPARSAVTVFYDRLRNLTGVKAIDAPASNLIQRDDPTYQFTLKLSDEVAATDETGATGAGGGATLGRTELPTDIALSRRRFTISHLTLAFGVLLLVITIPVAIMQRKQRKEVSEATV